MERYHAPGGFVSRADIRNHADAVRLAGGNGLRQDVAVAKFRVGAEADTGNLSVLTDDGDADGVGVHPDHGIGQGLRVVFES